MRSSRTRSLLLTAVLLALCGLGWLYLAPTQIGGSTRYMITHGISMEPLLHTGDLVLVRPADNYKVGEVVAYRSTVLHTVVLHRIHRIENGHYIFKGDNNDFLDPTQPTRALLLGRMWLHIPHGGIVLDWVHRPWVAALLTGGVALLLLFGGDQKRRRRRRRQPSRSTSRPARGPSPVTNRHLLAACAVITALFAALSIFAYLRPTAGTSTVSIPYTQRVSFGYHGRVRPGPVYPNGVVTTGDPLYTQLVHRLSITAAYQLTTAATHRLRGSVRIRGKLTNTSGWSRSFWLGPPAQIVGGRAVATAKISVPRLEALTSRVSSQIGPTAGAYTLAVEPQLSIAGEVAGQPLSSGAQPSLNLALGNGQLLSSAAVSAATASGSASSSGLVDTTTGNVTTVHAAADELGTVPMKTVRVIGLAGFALFALLALLLGLRERGAAPDPVERINSRYKHLIVPVSSVATDPEHPPIEVRTIEALAQLAERSERLILHSHQDGVDSYLIDDQGTLFRYQASRAGTAIQNGAASAEHGNASAGTRAITHAHAAADTQASAGTQANAGTQASAGTQANAGTQASAGTQSSAGTGATSEADATAHDVMTSTTEGSRTTNVAGAESAAREATAGEVTASRGPGTAANSHNHSLGDEGDGDGGLAAATAATRAGSAPTRGPARGIAGGREDGSAQPPRDQSATGAGATRPIGARRPPRFNSAHSRRRPPARAGLTIGPLALAFLVWRRLRKRRLKKRRAEPDDRWSTRNDRRRSSGSDDQQPNRGPGDRRRGERRRG